MIKICKICNRKLPEEDFTKNHASRQSGNGSWEGRRPECKKCWNNIANKRNKDKYKLYWSKRDSHNPEHHKPYYGNIKLEKKCASCKIFKLIIEFGKQSNNFDGLNSYCKHCFKIINKEPGLRWKSKNKDKLRKYSRESARKAGTSRSLRQRLSQLNKRNKLFGSDNIIDYNKFTEWYQYQKKICFYCDVPESLIIDGIWSGRKVGRKNKYGHSSKITSLTFDRKDNTKEYELENMCLACDNCNMSKRNLFESSEFREIAQKYIKPKWEILVDKSLLTLA